MITLPLALWKSVHGAPWPEQRRLWLFVFIAVFSCVVGFVCFDGAQSVTFFCSSTYWANCLWAALMAGAGWRIGRQTWVDGVRLTGREWLQTGIGAGLAFWLVLVLQTPGLRIVDDDSVLANTARNLFEAHEPGQATRNFWVAGEYVQSAFAVDKRPTLFPWLVSVVHALGGYRFANGFFVNFACALLLGVVLSVMGRRLNREWGGYLLPLLVFCPPITAYYASGCGFDVANLLAVAVMGHAAMLAIEKPDEARTAWLALAAVGVANIRYEGVVFFLPVGWLILRTWLKAGRLLLPLGVLVAPLLMVPWAWRQRMFEDERVWQFAVGPAGGGAPFSWRLIPDNLGHALNFFLSDRAGDGNSVLLFVVGGVAVAFVPIVAWRRRRVLRAAEGDELGAHFLWWALAVHFVVLLCYYWSQFDDPGAQRLALPAQLWLALSIVVVLAHLNVGRRIWLGAVVLASLHLVVLTAPRLNSGSLATANPAAWMHESIRRYFEANPQPRQLVITNAVQQLLRGDRIQTVDPRSVLEQPERIRYHWEIGTFPVVIAVQRELFLAAEKRWIVIPEDDLGPDFGMHVLLDQRVSPSTAFRIAKVTAIRSDHLAWRPRIWSEPEKRAFTEAETRTVKEWIRMMP